jgi:hypothetical protein
MDKCYKCGEEINFNNMKMLCYDCASITKCKKCDEELHASQSADVLCYDCTEFYVHEDNR